MKERDVCVYSRSPPRVSCHHFVFLSLKRQLLSYRFQSNLSQVSSVFLINVEELTINCRHIQESWLTW